MEPWTEYSRFFISLLVILDPFMAIPLYIALTGGYTEAEERRVVRVASIAVAVILSIMALSGEALLTLLGTSLGSFRVGGGIVLFIMALAMLQAKVDPVRSTPSEELSAATRASVAIVPLAIPMLAGPGAISTVVIATQRSQAAYHSLMIVGVIVMVSALLWVILTFARQLGDRLGEIGLNILNRVFGLILAAIAVEVISNGLKQLFPILGAMVRSH